MSNQWEQETYDPDEFLRHFRARLDAEDMDRKRERMRQEQLHEQACLIIRLGGLVIPSQHLKNHEIIVSEEVYRTVKNLL